MSPRTRLRVPLAAAVAVVAVVVLLTGAMVARGAPDERAGHAGTAVPADPARTTATPSSRGLLRVPVRARQAKVFVVGDSLTVGTEPWLRAALHRRGWSLAGVDARVGRPVAEGLRILRAHAARLPRTVLIALGTNDLGAPPAAVAGWLRAARTALGGRRIVWVDLCLADRYDPRLKPFRAIDAALATYAPRYRVEVADWCAYATAHGISPGPDGIHYLPAGYRQRASFYAAALATTAAGGRPHRR